MYQIRARYRRANRLVCGDMPIKKSLLGKPGTVNPSIRDSRDALSPRGTDVGFDSHRYSLGSLEMGQVLEVFPDTYTATVTLSDGVHRATVVSDSPVDPLNPQGDVSLPFVNSNVLVTRIRGQVIILKYLYPADAQVLGDEANSRRTKILEEKIGASDARYANKGAARRSGMRPSGVLPGDRLITGELGQMLGILTGGIALLKSGEQSQLMTFLRERLVKVVSGRFSLFSDWGWVQHLSDQGGTTLQFRGGSSSSAETGSNSWTIRGDLGALGNLVDLRITDKFGSTLSRLWGGKQGDVDFEATNVKTRIKGAVDTFISGALSRVVSGNKTERVKGDELNTVAGTQTNTLNNRVTTLSNNDQKVVLGDEDVNIGGSKSAVYNEGVTVAVPNGGATISLGAQATTAKPVDIELNRGDVTLNVSGQGNITLKTSLGSVTLTSSGDSITLNTGNLVGGVKLGSDSASQTLVLYTQLKTLLSTMSAAFDTHTHSLSGAGTPVAPLSPTVTASLAGVECQSVKVSS